MRFWKRAALALVIGFSISASPSSAQEVAAVDYAADARALDSIVVENYAYLDRFEKGQPPRSAKLDAMRDAVSDRRMLLAYAEAVLASLADHHAITGGSFGNSWAVIPSFADLWIVRQGDVYVVDAVRQASVAEASGVRVGDRLHAIGDVPTDRAVADYWSEIGFDHGNEERDAFAARVLAAGRRDRPRDLSFERGGVVRRLSLANLYGDTTARPPIDAVMQGDVNVVRINNSLGDDATIGAFDAAMARIPPGVAIEIDLTDTPSGGNTVIARAILGWFVAKPTAYQVHVLPSERRRTGIARQWIEQVLPRGGKHREGPVTVRVGRWTGSMGEGLAIGFDAIGARVIGGPMAGLLGAIYDFRLPGSGLVVKLPAERLITVDGIAREAFVPGAR